MSAVVTTGPLADFASASVVDSQAASELVCRAGAEPTERPVAPPALYLRQRLPRAAALLERTKRALRPLVRLLYVFPLLLLVKLVLRLAGVPYGDAITVAFVALVVAVFTLLALLLLLYPLAGPRSGRQPIAELSLPGKDDTPRALAALGRGPAGARALTAEQLAALCVPGAQRPELLRLRGTLAGGSGAAAGQPLLVDRWLQLAHQRAARVFCGHHLAVVGDDQPPVVVEFDAPCWLVADHGPLPRPLALPRPEELGDWLAARGADLETVAREGRGCQLVAGEQVELIATSYSVLRDVSELLVDGRPSDLASGQADGGGAGHGPYRRDRARPCLLVRCSPTLPVVLRPVATGTGA